MYLTYQYAQYHCTKIPILGNRNSKLLWIYDNLDLTNFQRFPHYKQKGELIPFIKLLKHLCSDWKYELINYFQVKYCVISTINLYSVSIKSWSTFVTRKLRNKMEMGNLRQIKKNSSSFIPIQCSSICPSFVAQQI